MSMKDHFFVGSRQCWQELYLCPVCLCVRVRVALCLLKVCWDATSLITFKCHLTRRGFNVIDGSKY